MELYARPDVPGKILIVEDLPETQQIIKASLSEYYQLTFVESCKKALEQVQREKYDLILLDLCLPDGDGLRLCAHIKGLLGQKHTPIFCVTAKSRIEDKAMGFSLGVVDYLTKPFEPLELKLRVDSFLRRTVETEKASQSLKLGNLTLDTSTHKAFVNVGTNSSEIILTTLEFRLIQYLVKNNEKVLSREQLLSAIWGNSVSVLDRAVDTCVAKIRSKLGKNAPYIKSVRGAGYKFSIE